MCCFVSFFSLVSFLLGLRRLRGWRYTLMVAVSLLLALACDVYHGQFMVCRAWAGGPSPSFFYPLSAFMHLVCTCSRHKLCLACYRVVNCVSQFLACHFCCIHGLLYSVAGCHVHFIFCIWSSYLIPYLHLPFLPMPTSPATRSLVGGHCLAYSCLGVFIQFCCFSPCIGLKCGHGHRYTITGFVKIFHLSCQRSPAFRVVAAQQNNKYIYIYIYNLCQISRIGVATSFFCVPTVWTNVQRIFKHY